MNMLSNYGVVFRSFTGPYLDTCGIFTEAVIAILGTIANQERLWISERVRAGLERARKEGTSTGRPIDRPRSVFRRDQVAELRAQGLSWPQIARKLGRQRQNNTQGIARQVGISLFLNPVVFSSFHSGDSAGQASAKLTTRS
jgi:DNA invertase Pin-like site-specific DNA recombinase